MRLIQKSSLKHCIGQTWKRKRQGIRTSKRGREADQKRKPDAFTRCPSRATDDIDIDEIGSKLDQDTGVPDRR